MMDNEEWKEFRDKKLKLADEARIKYYENHACCPKCGAEGHASTLMGYTMNVDNPEDYEDRNSCTCSECGDKHTTHDRVPRKEELQVSQPYTIVTNDFGQYKVNVEKIKTIKDIKLILKHLDLHFKPPSKEAYEEIKHLLIIN